MRVGGIRGQRVQVWVECCSKSGGNSIQKKVLEVYFETAKAHHVFLEPLSYERPATSLRNPWSDIRRKRVPICTTIVPEKCNAR